MYVVCPKSSCSGLAEEWDVNWRTPPALLTQQDPVDVRQEPNLSRSRPDFVRQFFVGPVFEHCQNGDRSTA